MYSIWTFEGKNVALEYMPYFLRPIFILSIYINEFFLNNYKNMDDVGDESRGESMSKNGVKFKDVKWWI